MQTYIKSLPKICLTLVLAYCLSACSLFRSSPDVDTESLPGLIAMGKTKRTLNVNRSMGKIREMAIRETALSIGAQSGIAFEAKHINTALTKQSRVLDSVYNFNSLILDPNILPPVLLEGRRVLNLADAQTIRLADRTYKVAKQARFVTTPPTWRQYLWMDYQRPDIPNAFLLPKTSEEQAVWEYYVKKGWRKGKEQASVILQESVARIKEDFRGMVLYRKLLAMNMISAPFVSHTNLGVTGDANEIHIDDKVLRITALPGLNVNSQEWIAAVATEQPTLNRLALLEKEALDNQVLLDPEGWRPIIAPVN